MPVTGKIGLSQYEHMVQTVDKLDKLLVSCCIVPYSISCDFSSSVLNVVLYCWKCTIWDECTTLENKHQLQCGQANSRCERIKSQNNQKIKHCANTFCKYCRKCQSKGPWKAVGVGARIGGGIKSENIIEHINDLMANDNHSRYNYHNFITQVNFHPNSPLDNWWWYKAIPAVK